MKAKSRATVTGVSTPRAAYPIPPGIYGRVEGWGFEYKTVIFVWVKITKDGRIRPDGIGRYTPNNVELVLLGKKGKYWRNSKKVKQVIMAQKTKHSEKPKEVYIRIEKLFGDVPRIELFARHRREGWDTWGNQVPSYEQKLLKIK